MKTNTILPVLVATLLLQSDDCFGQGGLTPTGAPAPTQKSLQEIWDKIGTLQTTVASQQALILQQSAVIDSMAAILGASNSWLITTVDMSGQGSSLAFAPGGQPAISYYKESKLKYAVFNGSTWTLTTVDDRVDTVTTLNPRPSLAFTPGGQPAISYTGFEDYDDYPLKYAVFNGSTWSIATVDNPEFSSSADMISLAFTPGGQPAIAYLSRELGALGTVDHLKYAVFDGSTWSITTVKSTADIQDASLAFNSGGQPAISYCIKHLGLEYAVFNSSTWTITTVDSTAVSSDSPGDVTCSLAFNPGGQPAISYETTAELRYAVFNGSTWTLTTVDDRFGPSGTVKPCPSLAITPAGQPAISYCTAKWVGKTNEDIRHFGALKYAVFNGSIWTLTTVLTEDDGWVTYPSLAFTPGGQPAISFSDRDGKLRFAIRQTLVSP